MYSLFVIKHIVLSEIVLRHAISHVAFAQDTQIMKIKEQLVLEILKCIKLPIFFTFSQNRGYLANAYAPISVGTSFTLQLKQKRRYMYA